MPQPIQNRPVNTAAIVGSFSDQITSLIGRHCQNNRIRTRLDSRTYVLRSIAVGTNCVHQRLNAGRAMRLCWMANNPNKMESIINASADNVAADPLSMDFGTTMLPTKPIEYRNVR